MAKRENFSRFGALMAMAGSAVGLGNIWRFPYLMGEDGGGAFIIVYLLCSFIISLPIFLSEAIIGRRGGSNCFGSFKKLSNNGKWKWVGLCGIITPLIILSYYCVIGGWSVHYLLKALSFEFSKADSQQNISMIFSNMNENVWPALTGFVIFIGASAVIVIGGVKKGIEAFGKIAMPSLFLIIIAIAVYSCCLPGAVSGIKYMFTPDFSKITPQVLADALGQSFYSLSLGAGCIMTYASYIQKKEDILVYSTDTVLIDLLFAIIAGVAIMPAVFAFGLNPGSGPSLVYETLPFVFSKMDAGGIVALIFFIALLVAALTSAISMLEVVVAYLTEEKHLPRRKATLLVVLFSFVLGTFCTLSFGPLKDFTIFGQTLFSICDKVSSNILMTMGALFTVLFAAWAMKKEDVKDEFTSGGIHIKSSRFFPVFYFLIRYIAPVGILVIFILNIVL